MTWNSMSMEFFSCNEYLICLQAGSSKCLISLVLWIGTSLSFSLKVKFKCSTTLFFLFYWYTLSKCIVIRELIALYTKIWQFNVYHSLNHVENSRDWLRSISFSLLLHHVLLREGDGKIESWAHYRRQQPNLALLAMFILIEKIIIEQLNNFHVA